MGIVYRAREYASGRVVALKMMHLLHLQTPEMMGRFESEVRAVASLDHPNIMPVYEVGHCDGIPFFSMKFAERGSLAGKARDSGPRAAAALVAKLARAVFHAHRRGVIHRDLKPGNILLDAAGEPYVADFGIAKIVGEHDHPATATLALGTPAYLAPELARGGPVEITTAVDIYGLGAIFYELLTGRPPATGSSPLEILRQVAQGAPPAPHTLVPALSRDLSAVCMKCLAPFPDNRYASAAELADDLDNYLAGRPVLARPPGLAGQIWRFCRRQPAIAGLGAGIAVLLAAIGIGSTIAAISIAAQRDRALHAEQSAQDRLHDSLLMQARLGRQTGQAGQRFDGLDVLRQAAAIRTTDDLRNEAAALLSLTDMRVARTFQVRETPNFPVAFDPAHERYLVCVRKDNALSLRRLSDHAEIASFPGTKKNILSLSPFSADGRYVASRHYDGPIRVWDTRELRMAFEINQRAPKKRPYQSVRFWFGCSFSRDGKLAAIELSEGGYTIHETATGRELARFPDKFSAYALSLDDTGRRLAYADRGAGIVEIRDTLTGEKRHTLEHPAEVFCLEWSPDGTLLAVGCNDALIYLWNTATGERHRVLDEHRNRVTHLAFSPDGRLLASTSQERNIILWDPASGKKLVSYPDFGHEPVLRFSRDGKRLVSTNFQVNATVFEVATDDGISLAFSPQGRSHNAVVTASVDFSPDERWLVSTTRRAISLWDLRRHRLAAELRPGADTETSALFTPDGSALLVASRATGLARHPFDPANPAAPLGPPETLMKEPDFTLSDFGFSKHHALLANRSDGTALLWPLDPAAGAPRRFAVQPEALSAALSPDGKILATTTSGQSSRTPSFKVHLWDAATGEKIRELDGGHGGIARFTPGGERLLASGHGPFAAWDLATLTLVPGAPRLAETLGFCLSPDGRYLCLSGGDKIALYQGKNYDDLVIQLQPLGDRNAGSRTAFSRAGNLLAVQESDGVVRIWDLPKLRAKLAELSLDWPEPEK
ncbi:MAG: protein kinase [Opitutaceae bacterium]|jgi:WD40 repeat protein|nr:protein kinase [Opitutaceae bacterium]